MTITTFQYSLLAAHVYENNFRITDQAGIIVSVSDPNPIDQSIGGFKYLSESAIANRLQIDSIPLYSIWDREGEVRDGVEDFVTAFTSSGEADGFLLMLMKMRKMWPFPFEELNLISTF